MFTHGKKGAVLVCVYLHIFFLSACLCLARLDGSQDMGFFLFGGHIKPVPVRTKEAFDQSSLRGHALLVLGAADRPAVATLVAVIGSADGIAGESAGKLAIRVFINPRLYVFEKIEVKAMDFQGTFIIRAAAVIGGVTDLWGHPALMALDILFKALSGPLHRPPGQQVRAPFASGGVPVTGVVRIGAFAYLTAALANVDGGHISLPPI